MPLSVRNMKSDEVDLIIDYFHQATPEFLETLGVDPTRLPPRRTWREQMQRLFNMPAETRPAHLVIWLEDGIPIGFSTCDKIRFGESAFMHLHVTQPDIRNKGRGAECVRLTADIYFDEFKLKRLYCQPNAFNTAPNRTLQRAGFRYVKTYKTVPNPLNYHQAVTQWLLER